MKRHDFESTSKKNIKEQTPEMAEREQEILMWMGDIRDDFILEAEDYKHYQSDKSVPGYFIVGGTLAAAAAICTAIFFQTGRNRIDHSNVPMQLPYQTEETKEIEWETEEETTEAETIEEETTQAETTEAETTQVETTEAASQETTKEDGSLSAAASEPFANNLPIAEDEYLVLTTGEGSYNWLGGDMVLALDSSGEEVLRLPGYGITGNSEYISNGMIVDENTPLVLYTGYEDGAFDDSDYASAQMGIYSLKDRKWIVEPARQSVTLFSDSVYMIGSDVGNLYRTDGTCIEEGAENVTMQGNFIISRRAVYDKTGQLLIMIQENESVQIVLYDEILINQYFTDGSHYTKCVNAKGETIWIEQSGLTWTGGEAGWGIYNSWSDTNGKGLLTAMGDDNTFKIVLSEDEFFAKNPDAQGNGLSLIAVTANNEWRYEFFLQTTSAEHQKIYYYRCDYEFNIIDMYPQNQISLSNRYNEACLWYWGLDESGNGFVENLIEGNKIKVDAEIMNEILQCSDVQLMHGENIVGLLFDQNKKFLYGNDNATHVISENGGITARIASQKNVGAAGIDILSIAYAEKEYSEILYYLPDGTVLDGYGTILFLNEQMKCVQEVGHIVIRDSMGNVRKEIDMIPGSKGQKADASLLARGFLNS